MGNPRGDKLVIHLLISRHGIVIGRHVGVASNPIDSLDQSEKVPVLLFLDESRQVKSKGPRTRRNKPPPFIHRWHFRMKRALKRENHGNSIG